MAGTMRSWSKTGLATDVLLETLDDESVATLADGLELKVYQAGEEIRPLPKPGCWEIGFGQI